MVARDCGPALGLGLYALDGLRGRKKAWWIDSPRPLRSVLSRGRRHEISVVALPGGTELPPAAFPAGSLLFCRPLLGQIEVRRVRRDRHDRGGRDGGARGRSRF